MKKSTKDSWHFGLKFLCALGVSVLGAGLAYTAAAGDHNIYQILVGAELIVNAPSVIEGNFPMSLFRRHDARK